MIRGHVLKMVSYLPHVKEPVMKGHLSCRDTFSRILMCPLKTGFTKTTIQQKVHLQSTILFHIEIHRSIYVHI